MGSMANHIGAPDSALKALREASSDPDIVKVYPPDCMPELKSWWRSTSTPYARGPISKSSA